jgi:hypothetical protein
MRIRPRISVLRTSRVGYNECATATAETVAAVTSAGHFGFWGLGKRGHVKRSVSLFRLRFSRYHQPPDKKEHRRQVC